MQFSGFWGIIYHPSSPTPHRKLRLLFTMFLFILNKVKRAYMVLRKQELYAV